jgi:hypothetical protein
VRNNIEACSAVSSEKLDTRAICGPNDLIFESVVTDCFRAKLRARIGVDD